MARRRLAMAAELYSVDVLIPTARLAFAVEDGNVLLMPEHKAPSAYHAYTEFRRRHKVVGMTTFPNTVLLRGPATVLVDPGLHLQNEPVLRALEARGLNAEALDLIVLTHAHLDHAGACADLDGPTAVHRLETLESHWPAVSGVLERRDLRLLEGEDGELAPGLLWTRTPGHTEGGISLRVATASGPVVLTGDIVGPTPEPFLSLTAPADDPQADRLLAAWKLIHSWRPTRIIPGHLPPLALARPGAASSSAGADEGHGTLRSP